MQEGGKSLLIIDRDGGLQDGLGLVLSDHGYVLKGVGSFEAALEGRMFRDVNLVIYKLDPEIEFPAHLIKDLVSQAAPAPVCVVGITRLEQAFACIHEGVVDIHPERIQFQLFTRRLDKLMNGSHPMVGSHAASPASGKFAVQPPDESDSASPFQFFSQLDEAIGNGGHLHPDEPKPQTPEVPVREDSDSSPRLVPLAKPGRYSLTGETEAMKTLRGKLERGKSFSRCLTLVGPAGVEFSAATRHLLELAQIPRLSLQTVSSNDLNLRTLLDWSHSFAEEGLGLTLVIEDLEQLNLEQQELLLQLMKQAEPFQKAKGVRVIFHSREDLNDLLEAGRLEEGLYLMASSREIAIPSLEQRLDDLPALSVAMLRALATIPEAYKDRLLSSVAMGWLKARSWPGELDQLWQFWTDLVGLEPEIPLSQGDLERSWSRVQES